MQTQLSTKTLQIEWFQKKREELWERLCDTFSPGRMFALRDVVKAWDGVFPDIEYYEKLNFSHFALSMFCGIGEELRRKGNNWHLVLPGGAG